MNQKIRVLNHLIDHGYITQVVASNYGIRRCAARINELKDRHYHPIEAVYKTDDAGVRYAYYTMPANHREALQKLRTKQPSLFT